jgi:hypothetical protein
MQVDLRRDKIRRVKAAILASDASESFLDIVARDRQAFSGLRVLYASDVSGLPVQEQLERTGYVSSVLCGRGVLAFSDDIEAQMRRGAANVIFGVRALFDTNLLSNLPEFLMGEPFNSREQTEASLQFVDEQFDHHIDWTFASLENLREVTKPNNPWPFLKVAAAYHFSEHGCVPVNKKELSAYIPKAEEQWRSWLASDICWRQIVRRDVCYAVTLFAVQQCWEGRAVEVAMSNLVEFCLTSLGIMPLKELYFGWKAIQGVHSPNGHLAVFSEKDIASPTKNSLFRISALAWDLFLFRWCETLMTELKGNLFFVPAVTTLDVNLLATIKACPLRAVLMDDAGKWVESLFDDELDFQKCLGRSISYDMLQKIYEPAREANVDNISRYQLSEVITSLEKEVGDAVKTAKAN